MTFIEFKNNVELWAAERGIYDHSTTSAQLMKALSELGELADAIIKGDDEALKDAVGDVAVCVINAAYLEDVGLDKASRLVAMPKEPLINAGSSTPACVVGRIASGIGGYLSGSKDEYNRQVAFTGTVVALKSLCAYKGLDFMACCEHAWNEIKDRKGRMVAGGAFVKDEEAAIEVADLTDLRDRFAAKAMQGWVSDDSFIYDDTNITIAAHFAYAMADAMLKERNK